MTSNSPFGELAGIQPPREIAVHTASKLDQLVSVGNGIIKKYHSTTKGRDEWDEDHETYTAIEAELAGSELDYSVGEYGVSDLQDIVTAYSNKDESKHEAIVRGMYTGALASVLTKRNRKKGERTHIHLNGDRNTFPYLLYFAHTLDELTIENFRGDYIAAFAASYGGTANNITLTNITGDGAGGCIACEGGRVETVTLVNINGKKAGVHIARSKGQVDMVTLANIIGKWAGSSIAWYSGYVGVVTLVNITGIFAGINIASDEGRVNTLLTVNSKGKCYLNNNCAIRTITTLTGLANAQQIQSLLDELTQPDRAPQHYAQASEQLGKLLRAQP